MSLEEDIERLQGFPLQSALGIEFTTSPIYASPVKSPPTASHNRRSPSPNAHGRRQQVRFVKKNHSPSSSRFIQSRRPRTPRTPIVKSKYTGRKGPQKFQLAQRIHKVSTKNQSTQTVFTKKVQQGTQTKPEAVLLSSAVINSAVGTQTIHSTNNKEARTFRRRVFVPRNKRSEININIHVTKCQSNVLID